MTAAADLVRKLWQYCNVLRDDGLSYPDYVEQLTYLLFLKMADERPGDLVPESAGWQSFATLDGVAMHAEYTRVLAELGEKGGTLGLIFGGAANKITDPAKLRLLVVGLVGQTDWSAMAVDVKGEAYEGLLEKNARDTKSGAGQYFTPRPLVQAVVECVDPRPDEVICDPACGTGGFLLAAHQHIRHRHRLSQEEDRHLRTHAIRGVELVQEVARLAAMNLFLHGVSGNDADELPIACADSLRTSPVREVDVVLTNPPFGIKGTITYVGGETDASDGLTVSRRDFRVRTANKQLNFVQHVLSLLKAGGRAAMVIPDNVLFETGPASLIRDRLLRECDVHTLLRLPPGLFYAQGVLANVLFFDAHPPPTQAKLWVYDLRSGNRFSVKTSPLAPHDLAEFVTLFLGDRRAERELAAGAPRWHAVGHDELADRDGGWIDFGQTLGAPVAKRVPGLARVDELAMQIAADLEVALAHVARAGKSGAP